jgi:hypothetical protein
VRCAVQYQQPKLSAVSRVDLFGGNRRRATADVTRHVKCLEPRSHALGEKLDVAFGEIVRHSALAQQACRKLGQRLSCARRRNDHLGVVGAEEV